MKFARMRAMISRNHIAYAGTTLATALLMIAAPTLTSAQAEALSIKQPDVPGPIAEEAAVPPQIDGRISDRHSLGHDGVRVRGVVTDAGVARSLVTLQVRISRRGGWRSVVKKRVTPGRRFSLSWYGARPGRYSSRLVLNWHGIRAVDHLGSVFVYRRSFASWYGPGFYGHRTACGGRLTASVLGVAHKTLPCGTPVTFHLHGKTVTARVIDRGPFIAGRDWDLTPALKRRLHFGSTGVVHTTR